MKHMMMGLMMAASTALPACAADKAEIMAVNAAFSQLSVQQGAHAAFDHYLAKDAVKLDGGRHAVIGHDAALKGFEGWPEGTRLVWWPKDGRVAASDDLAYTWGTYEFHYTEEGEARVSHGKYATIWARESGAWKAILDTGTPSPGPAPH